MTPATELVECANCACWFSGASVDDVFYHATSGCCRDLAAVPAPASSPAANAFTER